MELSECSSSPLFGSETIFEKRGTFGDDYLEISDLSFDLLPSISLSLVLDLLV